MPPTRVFLLSPARCGGRRTDMVLRSGAEFELALRLREPAGAELGEVFAFLSGLYFRGKLAYARAFARPPAAAPGALVITPTRGLLPPEARISRADLEEFAEAGVALSDPAYREPLERDARRLEASVGDAGDVVLLGSIATGKYVDVLAPVFGLRLLFPAAFVGRGDMSRGGLLLRAAAAGLELAYLPVLGAVRRGPRPPRLGPPP